MTGGMTCLPAGVSLQVKGIVFSQDNPNSVIKGSEEARRLVLRQRILCSINQCHKVRV